MREKLNHPGEGGGGVGEIVKWQAKEKIGESENPMNPPPRE